MAEYKPVACDFVDQIEIAALRGKVGTIRYRTDDRECEIEDSVKTWETRAGEEFLITGSGQEIRLDRITWLIDQPGPKGGC